MRRKGQTINNISKFLGRSTSFVYRIIHQVSTKTTLLDMRKYRTGRNKVKWFFMVKLMAAWEKFLLGESERPP